MGVTLEKMAAQLRRAIQAVLDRGLHDPRVKGLVTVTRVELSPDFANATVHVTVLPEEQAKLTLHGLRNASAHVRSQVSRRSDFRRVPALHFRHDIVRRRESEVLSAIARATAEDEERARARAAAGETAPAPGEDAGGGGAADADVMAAFDAFLDERGTAGKDDVATGAPARAGAAGDASDAGDDIDPDSDHSEHTDGAGRGPRAEDHAT